jgi:hypothetical protein
MALSRVEGTISATGATPSVEFKQGGGSILLDFSSGVGTVKVEKSFDGTTWYVASKDSKPTEASYTESINGVVDEREANVLYRFNCTSYTSGSIAFRLSS